jgi:hypothetical protein
MGPVLSQARVESVFSQAWPGMAATEGSGPLPHPQNLGWRHKLAQVSCESQDHSCWLWNNLCSPCNQPKRYHRGW